MLMRNFKTPTDLNLTDKQFDALIQVLGMLERDELPWHQGTCSIQTPAFNMQRWPDYDCGTVGCIGFWYEKLINNHYDYTNKDLSNLFFTHELDGKDTADWTKIGPDHAASALRNYLTTGKADWTGVLA